MEPKVSIIVPVYNAEKSLARCVDSILNQEFRDFELLLTALGAELSDRNTRCIIDGDICICDTVDGIDQLAPVLIREGTLTELIRIDERLHREHTVDELLPAHLE